LGPIRGLLTAMENVKTELVVVATVDMPMVRNEHLRWLVEELTAKPQAVGCMSLPSNLEKQIEPFPSSWRTEFAKDIVQQHIANGRRSVYSLRDQEGIFVLEAPREWPESIWLNLNSAADLDELKKLGVRSAGFGAA
jgi:molybdopterin-guanine dinucleotide biosynthesis protein A